MPKITPITPKDMVKKLKKLWFEWPYPWWRHLHMIKWEKIIPVPMHWWKDLGIWLICSIIDELWISRDERMKL